MGAVVLLAAADAQPVAVSAISLHDDAATIAAADAAKYEVLRRQQEQARIAQLTRVAIAEATRQEQARVAEGTRQAAAATVQQQQLYVQATATGQAIISRSLALSATAAAVAIVNAEGTRVAQAVEAERVAQVQAEEAARIANEAYARRAVLQQVGVVVLFAVSVALCVAVVRGLWKIGRSGEEGRGDRTPTSEANKSATTDVKGEAPEVVTIDDPAFAEMVAQMWNTTEKIE